MRYKSFTFIGIKSIQIKFCIIFRAAQLNALAQICPIFPDSIKHNEFFSSKSIYNIIEDLAPNLEYAIKECRWQQKKIKCSEYLSSVFTRRGFCFTFNDLNSYDMYTDQ